MIDRYPARAFKIDDFANWRREAFYLDMPPPIMFDRDAPIPPPSSYVAYVDEYVKAIDRHRNPDMLGTVGVLRLATGQFWPIRGYTRSYDQHEMGLYGQRITIPPLRAIYYPPQYAAFYAAPPIDRIDWSRFQTIY